MEGKLPLVPFNLCCYLGMSMESNKNCNDQLSCPNYFARVCTISNIFQLAICLLCLYIAWNV